MESKIIQLLSLVPKNGLSRAVGGVLRGPWPGPIHKAAIRLFVEVFGVDTEEAELPLEEYATLSDFFVRRLRPGARSIDGDPQALVSPCDGVLGASGGIEAGMLLQAKGRAYSAEQFLGDAIAARRYEGGSFATIYLAPPDYHRVHFPADGVVTEARHIPGTLWPVNPPAVERIDDLFAVNERLITHLETDSGPVCVAMVGATCVGRIRMLYDEGVTNAKVDLGLRRYHAPLEVKKGDELGVFEMGSTVVLLTGPGGWRLEPAHGDVGERDTCEGSQRPVPSEPRARKIRFGEALGRAGADAT